MSSPESESIAALDEVSPAERPASRREALQERPSFPDEAPAATNQAAAPRSPRQQRMRGALFLLLPIVLIGAVFWYVYGGRVTSTDDAYINAEKVGISTDVSGTVADVAVRDNQEVAPGQLLYRLDPLQFQIALARAEANRAQIALTLTAMQRDYRRMLTEAAAQQAQVALDRTQFDRAVRLLANGVESRADYDRARYKLQADGNQLGALREQASVQLARLDGNPNLPLSRLPEYMQAQAQVAEAQRELNHTVVRAPFAGVVTDVPAIAPGKYLVASTTAFYLVDTHHIWVDATPKETQLTYVRSGQPATVTVDTYPNLQWHGTVQSISPAAAQEFSLLPAQNSSGNWVKVVQRVQLRIRLDTSDRRMPPLSAGMSVDVYVDTGHPRGWPHFLTDLL
ncbi:MAG TPA: HlyD family secretion protein [Steroidobacteraceae bacterium]|jgi:membrane fusion protein (multidrug efflux system)|nr:HlyD family secretion protein [Steroidobacteraceae bacterium]